MHTHADLPPPFRAAEPEAPAPVSRGIPEDVAAGLRRQFGTEWSTERSRRGALDLGAPAPTAPEYTHADLPPPPPPEQVLRPKGEADGRGGHDPRHWVDRHQRALKKLLAAEDPEAAVAAMVEAETPIAPDGEVWSRARWLLELCDLVGERRLALGIDALVGLGRGAVGPFFLVTGREGVAVFVPDEVLRGPWDAAGEAWPLPSPSEASEVENALLEARGALLAQRALAPTTGFPGKAPATHPAIEEEEPAF